MSTSSPIPSDISRTTAPLLLGALLNWLLYGVLIMQVYSYHQYFPRDRTCNKILVHAVFIIETVQTLFTGADSSYWFITGFGNFERLRQAFLAPVDRSILNLLVAITVRSFFCYRIWDVKKSLFWWCCVIAALSLVQCIGNLADGILGLKYGNIDGPDVHVYFIYIGLVGSALADFAVTATLTCLLAGGRRKRESKSLMAHASILRFTVETNFVSASMSAFCLILFGAAPNDVYWFCPAVIIGKAYSITLLASFNRRIDYRRNASVHLSTPPAGTPIQIEENSWTFADYFVGRPSLAVKSAPPFIVSFDQEQNFDYSRQGQPRPLSMQCLHSPQDPQALAPSLRQRIEVPLSASLRAKTAFPRIPSFGLPIRPLPPTPSVMGKARSRKRSSV